MSFRLMSSSLWSVALETVTLQQQTLDLTKTLFDGAKVKLEDPVKHAGGTIYAYCLTPSADVKGGCGADWVAGDGSVVFGLQVSGGDVEVAFARHCFRQIYGVAADRWDVRVSPGAVGHPRVVSGVDQDLLDELRGAFSDTGLKLRSIQPYLMAALNKWRRKLDNRACLFVVAEERFYTCMVVVGGRCQSVHTGAFSGPLNDSLPIILEREFMRSGLEERPSLFLYAGGQPDVELGRAESWSGIARELNEDAGIAASLEPGCRSAVLAL